MSEPSLRSTVARAIEQAHDHSGYEAWPEMADAALRVIREEVEARMTADPDPGKEPKSRWERWNLRQRERERLLATLGAEP
jgi:hypothetical protein